MKKYSIYAFMSAIALTGAVGFSSCSSSSDEVIPSPDYNQETEVVKTQFSISLPSNVNAPKTRQSAMSVQNTAESFRGMSSIFLVPFTSKATSSTSTRGGDPINLEPIASDGLNNLSGTTASKYKVYSNVSIPIGTSAFLFYAEATRGSADANFVDGYIEKIVPVNSESNPNGAKTAGYTFSPKSIYDGSTTNTIGDNLAAYLSTIAKTEGWSTSTDEPYKDLYKRFTSIRAGSSAAIQRTVTDLWTAVKPLSDGTSNLAYKIVSAILSTTYGVSVSGETLTFGANISGYPDNLNLPDGAAALKWDSSNKTFTVDNDGSPVTRLSSYVYPAALWYRANTQIKVSNTKLADETTGAYPSDKTTWNTNEGTDVLSLYFDGSVSPSTRSVALNDVIQYAVGRLDVKVKCDAGTLYDYKGDPVIVNESGFPVTAILIGGQKPVDFQFTSPSGNEYTIYDKDVTGAAATTSEASWTNYTLALETEPGIDINIAIEFKNNSGNDFIGKDGQLIPKDGKFYLTAKLAAASAMETETKVFKQDFYTVAKLTIKPGTPSASLAEDAHNETGLGTATNTIPDLRTPKLELGMAVDLSWQQGHTYEVELK